MISIKEISDHLNSELSTFSVRQMMDNADLQERSTPMDIAARRVVRKDIYDPESTAFMTEAFRLSQTPFDLDPRRTSQDIIDDAMMKYTEAYNEIFNQLISAYIQSQKL